MEYYTGWSQISQLAGVGENIIADPNEGVSLIFLESHVVSQLIPNPKSQINTTSDPSYKKNILNLEYVYWWYINNINNYLIPWTSYTIKVKRCFDVSLNIGFFI